jgi:S1-C subfamily serine protease
MRLPDWLVYLLVIGVIVWVLYRVDDPNDMAPPSPPDLLDGGPLLPPASMFDPEVLVEVGPITSGVGTAFAINQDGYWLTARHVVGDCERVGIIVGRRAAAPAQLVSAAPFADLAILKTDRAPPALTVELDDASLRVDQLAFHVGYPQGRAGEAVSRLYRRERLVARGRYQSQEPVLAWAEVGRTRGLSGTLAGISGGPVFDEAGQVIGVTIAESARRGRLYTAPPSSIARLLGLARVETDGERVPAFDREDYGRRGDELRRALSVAQVVCIAPDIAGAPAQQ